MIREYIKDKTKQVIGLSLPHVPDATPSVEILDDGGSTLTAAGTSHVTLDATTTTITTDVDAGATTLPVASTTGFVVGRTYILKNVLQQEERIRVTGISGSSSLIIDTRTAYDNTKESHIYSTWVEYALQTADVDTLRERCQAIVTYEVDSIAHDLRELFDVVLHPLPNPLTREVLFSYSPDIRLQEWAEQNGEDYARQRDAVWDRIMRSLRRVGRRPALIANSIDLVDWALAELSLQLQGAGVSILRNLDQDTALTRLEERRNKERTQAIDGLQWYDASEDDSVDDDTETGAGLLTMDFVR